MKPLELSATQAPLALAALRAVALADGVVAPAERELLEVHAELFEHEGDLDALPQLDLAALRAAFPDPAHRASLVQRLVLMAMLDGEVRPEEIARTREIAQHLGVLQPAIRQMELFVAGRTRQLGIDLMRRSFLATKLARIWHERGLRGILEVAKQGRGKHDPQLAARYVALGDLPEGTLGRELFAHFRRNEYAMPGEEGSAPEALLFHDVGHVLAGYGTDPEGEVQMAGFEAGFMGEDGFSITLFVLYMFHLGADVNPTVKATRGRFQLAPFRAAFHVGQTLREDLRFWDPWPHFARPVPEVRRLLGMAEALA